MLNDIYREKYHLQNRGVKMIIEPLMRDEINTQCAEIQWYCFDGMPKVGVRIEKGTDVKTTLYDEEFNIIYDTLTIVDEQVNRPCDELIKQTYELSNKLACHKSNYCKENYRVGKEINNKNKQNFADYINFSDYINQTFDLYKKSANYKYGREKEQRKDNGKVSEEQIRLMNFFNYKSFAHGEFRAKKRRDIAAFFKRLARMDKEENSNYLNYKSTPFEMSGIFKFNFVRVDWLIYNNKIYFEEMTFTPYSGFNSGLNPKFDNYFSGLINL